MTEVPQTTRVPQWTFGDRLKKAREHAGLTQAELAEMTGISRATISNYEVDKFTPTKPNLNAWSLATGVPAEWLRDGTDSHGQDPGPGGIRAGQRGRVLTYIASRKCPAKASVIPHWDDIRERGPFPGRIAA
jgi:transcriptional regulator with XRE-family HTH domain